MSGLNGLNGKGCPLCSEPSPHVHDLGPILNSRIYCPDGSTHTFRKRVLRRSVCEHCGQKELK